MHYKNIQIKYKYLKQKVKNHPRSCDLVEMTLVLAVFSSVCFLPLYVFSCTLKRNYELFFPLTISCDLMHVSCFQCITQYLFPTSYLLSVGDIVYSAIVSSAVWLLHLSIHFQHQAIFSLSFYASEALLHLQNFKIFIICTLYF